MHHIQQCRTNSSRRPALNLICVKCSRQLSVSVSQTRQLRAKVNSQDMMLPMPQTLMLLCGLVCACACDRYQFREVPGAIRGSVRLGDSEYLIRSEALTWGAAWAKCRSFNSHLIVVDTPEESGFITELLDYHSLEEVYVGIHDIFHSGSYTTVLDETLSSTAFSWAQEEPTGDPEHCGFLNRMGELGDTVCTRELSFICEKTIKK